VWENARLLFALRLGSDLNWTRFTLLWSLRISILSHAERVQSISQLRNLQPFEKARDSLTDVSHHKCDSSVTVDYTTHACSRVTVEGEGPMTSGCVTSMANNSRTIEVCACTSINGYLPCNSGQHPYNSLTVTSLLMVFFLALKCVT